MFFLCYTHGMNCNATKISAMIPSAKSVKVVVECDGRPPIEVMVRVLADGRLVVEADDASERGIPLAMIDNGMTCQILTDGERPPVSTVIPPPFHNYANLVKVTHETVDSIGMGDKFLHPDGETVLEIDDSDDDYVEYAEVKNGDYSTAKIEFFDTAFEMIEYLKNESYAIISLNRGGN